MLKLKRVELQGFKSFCDRSEMKFHGSGIAAIVGPNGCGKSNLSDAISWVLGEQSAKSLRGSRMEDVIFAGTRDRKQVGMASVTLTLVDPAVNAEFPFSDTSSGQQQASPKGAEEIVITRRLYRSGESEYLINGRSARLRDIQDLFMGTGLGPESYAIIEQGRIGQILSTKPADRRAVIEEAAGVTRFKTKKRLAESKLESAKANLSRVFDILEEVSRQMNSLKRQAAKTKRHGELQSEMVTQLRIVLAGRFRLLERDAAKTALDLNAATSEYQKLIASITERETEHGFLQEASYSNEAALTAARKQLSEHKIEAERVRGKLETQAREIANIEQRLTRGESESEDLGKRFESQQLELGSSTEQLAALDKETEKSRANLTQKSQERDRLQNALRERERLMETSRQQVLRLLGEASSLKNQLTQTDQYLLGVNRDTERIQRDEQSASAELQRLDGVKKSLSEQVAARQLELRSTTDERRSIEAELATRRQSAGEARRKLDELRNDASRLKARRDSLAEVLSHRSYTTEAVKRLFKAVEGGQAQDLKPAGVLADFVEVLDPAYEKATEEFLHEELEYVVVQNWEQAERGIGLMRSNIDGRATFLVHPEPDTVVANTPRAEPDAPRLRDVLRLTNGLSHSPADLIPRLATCFLAEDRASAQKLALAHPEFYFLLPDGVCYHGHAVSGGKKTGSGPLGLKRELKDVTAQWQNRQGEFEKTQSFLQDLEREIAQFSEDLERLRGLQQKQEKDAVALDHDMRKMGEEFSRANSRLSVARMDLQRLSTETEKAKTRRTEQERLVSEKEAARVQQEQVLTEARAGFDTLQADMARIGEEHSALRVELAGLEERRRSESSARQRLENQIREIAQRRQHLTQEMERLGVEKARLLSDNIGLDERATVLGEAMADGERQVSELAEIEAKGRAALASADEQLKASRIEVQAASDKRSQTELELVKKQAELKYLDETCRKELNEPVEELARTQDGELDEITLADSDAKYQEVRAKLESLGPVNPTALEEFEEAEQRYNFLNAQRQDLLDSIRDTEKAIHEIDVESRKRFTEAFAAINDNFREMFKTLFGGGVGEMRLNDIENASESGIDIVASPPGKRLQSVLLLSGGERALTAMALLMAIFKYQPSPFCVLDEVDAPLDEANIERLTRLLREMASQTQFVVITHSKRTMEAAQTLYGVTMQEPGVSKLVSVKFAMPAPPPPPPVIQPELTAV